MKRYDHYARCMKKIEIKLITLRDMLDSIRKPKKGEADTHTLIKLLDMRFKLNRKIEKLELKKLQIHWKMNDAWENSK